MNQTPVYKFPVAYARENGELEQYRTSLKTFAECKHAIDEAINANWDGMNFSKDAAKSVLKEFGTERVTFILAYTVRERNMDNRFSGHNASWANTISMCGMGSGCGSCILESHPAKVDLFIDLVQQDLQELAQEKPTARQKGSERKKSMPPLYKESFEYAYEHGEKEQHRASNRANIACKDAIETAISNHYSGNCLNTAAVNANLKL